jgi:hypothetical protein
LIVAKIQAWLGNENRNKPRTTINDQRSTINDQRS